MSPAHPAGPPAVDLRGRSLLKKIDLSAGEYRYLIDLGARLRLERRMGERMHSWPTATSRWSSRRPQPGPGRV